MGIAAYGKLASRLRPTLHADHVTYLAGSASKTDRMTMAHSVEARLHF
jgi:hypothetical protein